MIMIWHVLYFYFFKTFPHREKHELTTELKNKTRIYLQFLQFKQLKKMLMMFHMNLIFTGVGILSVPYALASGGWLSLLLLFSIAAGAFYSGILMKRCMEKNSNIKTYPEIGELAFGKIGRLVVSISMYTELYLVSTGFLILEGDNLSNIFPIEDFQVFGLSISAKQFFVILVAIIVLPTVWLDDLSLLSYVSASGVFASAIIILSISWTAAFDGVGVHQKGDIVNWNGIPTAVSLYAFCYCAHPVFPTLYTSMKNKHQFSNVSVLLIFAFWVCFDL